MTQTIVPKKNGSRRAYSLLELSLVVAIIGFLAAIAVPRMADATTRHRVQAAGQRIVHDLTLAQKQARCTSTSRTVVFDIASDSYAIIGENHLDRTGATWEVRLAEPPYRTHIFVAQLDIEDTNPKFIFDGYGMPEQDGVIIIGIGQHYRMISVDAESGEVTFQ